MNNQKIISLAQEIIHEAQSEENANDYQQRLSESDDI